MFPGKQLLIQQVGFVNSRHFFHHWSRENPWFKNLKILKFILIFKGIRYSPPKENPELIAIYDVQGYIAGMQSVVSKKFDTSQYDFENSGWYKKGTVLGEDVYLLTVYFTDPTKICSKGRSAKDFENQGIGNILWFEKTDGSLVQAPLTMDKADDSVSKHFSLYLSYIFKLLQSGQGSLYSH